MNVSSGAGWRIEHFHKELSLYDCAKGTVRFPLGKPVPLDLISRIVQFRAAENHAKAAAKGRAG
ncbi:hypothetical protein [Chlorobium ferrooxidans]|uniref:Uncharacterized protein n=1 Tax=Chlorobium ferrooxidans DSM 13031 TaxID=377431 RepID=Q0YSW3_9CHLB|nr:hypothetical protein [Chlorobium ferrooxidans]EAT59501.1 hypothetical protein CferDRAFT_1428 [Chlorobium ferrooxidans DSM 13031]